MSKFILTVILSLFLYMEVQAQFLETPTKTELKKVLEYFFHGGNNGPVLIEAKICTGIHKTGEKKNDCIGIFPNNRIQVGKSAIVWMNYFINRGHNYSVIIQHLKDDIVRKTREISFNDKGYFRYRYPMSFTTGKIGKWTIRFLFEKEGSVRNLGEMEYEVIK